LDTADQVLADSENSCSRRKTTRLGVEELKLLKQERFELARFLGVIKALIQLALRNPHLLTKVRSFREKRFDGEQFGWRVDARSPKVKRQRS